MTTRTLPSFEDAERLASELHVVLDRLAGRVSPAAHGALLDARADVYALAERLRKIRIFEADDRP